jgi:hypothetical protein
MKIYDGFSNKMVKDIRRYIMLKIIDSEIPIWVSRQQSNGKDTREKTELLDDQRLSTFLIKEP